MLELIVAMDEKGGIGFQGNIPWNIPEELKLFRTKTMGKTLVMGRKTMENIPKLKGRNILCVTKYCDKSDIYNKNRWKHIPDGFVCDMTKIPEGSIVAGGAEIYEMTLKQKIVNKIHLSEIKGEHKCDKFFDKKWLQDFIIEREEKYEQFTHYTLVRSAFTEHQYLNLMCEILENGKKRVGRNGLTFSIFKSDMTFDLRKGFPLLTTKKMFFRGILEEFLFFLKGNTDSTYLSEKNIRIWEDNTSEEFINNRNLPYNKGVMGPMYGYQWRFFNAEYKVNSYGRPLTPQGGIDQLANVVDLIKNDPHSRRILLTSYNPTQANEGVLYPCHSITIQFYVDDNDLDMFCYNRSQDIFLGVPFNIASSSLLLMIVAKLTGKNPRFFHMTLGDTHIYECHTYQVLRQLSRVPYKFPVLKIPEVSLDNIPNLNSDDFFLENYKCHPTIKAKMVA